MSTCKHIVHYLWGFHTGGLENGVVNLINQLPPDQFRHTIITQCGFDPEFFRRITSDNCEIIDLHKKPGLDFALYWRLLRTLTRLKPDVFHSRGLTAMEGQFVAALAKIPLRVHGEHGWDINDVGGINVRYQKLRRLLSVFVHRFIVLSSEAEEYLKIKINIESRKIIKICNGVDFSRFASSYNQSNTLNGVLNKENFVFGTVGRQAKVKNQQLLITAFSMLIEKYPAASENVRLLLVGDGPEQGYLKKMVVDLKIENKVIFTGNRPDIPEMMSLIDVFVLPSLAEGISNTILEAMASGIPVLASHVGGNQELLPLPFKDTHIFPSADPKELMELMAMYFENPELAIENGEISKTHCKMRYSLDSMVDKYKKVYLLS